MITKFISLRAEKGVAQNYTAMALLGGKRFAAPVRNDTHRPSELIDAYARGPLLWLPSLATDTRVVLGVQLLDQENLEADGQHGQLRRRCGNLARCASD